MRSSDFEGDVGIGDQGQRRVDHLARVVRRDVGGHPHRDAAGAVDQQVGEARRQNLGLVRRFVVIGLEIDRVLVDVLQQQHRRLGQARFGVAHRRRRIAVDRAEIALPVDQRHPHRKGLRHPHQRVVDRGVAVRMILAHDVAHHAGGFAIGLVRRVAGFLHGEQDSPMHRLQPVARVGQRARDDHAHRVIEIGAAHLLFDGHGHLPLRRNGRGRGGLIAHACLGLQRAVRVPGGRVGGAGDGPDGTERVLYRVPRGAARGAVPCSRGGPAQAAVPPRRGSRGWPRFRLCRAPATGLDSARPRLLRGRVRSPGDKLPCRPIDLAGRRGGPHQPPGGPLRSPGPHAGPPTAIPALQGRAAPDATLSRHSAWWPCLPGAQADPRRSVRARGSTRSTCRARPGAARCPT